MTRRIVVCGAGIAGLAVAHRLAADGAEVVVLERAPRPRTQGYMIDFFGPGYDAMEAMGLEPRLREVGYPFTEATYFDERGRRRAGLRYDQFATAIGGRLLSIMRPDLEQVLREALPVGVRLRFGTSLTGVRNEAGGVEVELAGGETIEADLLVGADGIHSTVRRLVFGPEREFFRYLGFHTAAFLVEDAEIHRVVANRFGLTDTVDRQMGFYGLRDGRVAVFAVHRESDPHLPHDAREAVRRAYGSLGWVAPRVLQECPPAGEVYYDQVAQIEMPEWSAGRVTLAGDACQAVSLLAGQGASLAIAGAYVLADQLATAGPIEAALAGYERLWRPVVIEKQQAARRGVQWFLPGSRLQLRMRRIALKLARLPGIDRYVAGTLAGKSTTLIGQLAQARDQRQPVR
ncbi:FAD-dependent oxidoreductase [Amycolatopsis alkalitolerans]|uniref:FAD-dependent oxidoreductase n=1 Tax=Amycolatopsis alkalitolerans TaxID=2547244 RepID=A0A5C4M527_9PSEU|nr:FAD-dependent oxidoreductase [Amycolatopsis alkalitolerans]TNC26476.1 FAD-dependent oxidoreductase [Amycolatopsis alkalitolerans]